MSRLFDLLEAPLEGGQNLWREDAVLRHLTRRSVPEATWRWAEPELEAMGSAVGLRVEALAATADQQGPVLRTHDRTGARIDAVDYHPAYRELAEIAYGSGLVALKYDPVIRAAHPESLHAIGFTLGYLFAQGEQGLYCPLCMTDGAARIVERHGNEALRAYYLPRLASRHAETLMTGAMFLTEKQGGSDVGRNATRAVPEGRGEFGEVWRLYGEKWFCSNVDAGVALVLARPEGAREGTKGLGLFLLPRPLPDGSPQTGVLIDRLKQKLGTRSMPTGEVRLEGALAFPLGALDQGFKIMTEMVNLSRLYNAVASAAVMRRSYFEARRWARARSAFGRSIDGHPLTASALADLSAESIGATTMVFTAVHALDRFDARGSEADLRLVRLLTPLCKGYLGKRAVQSVSEAMEVLGGNGYTEEWPLARMLRDAQVLPIWEGTTNIQVLDAFRAMTKESAHVVLFEALRAAIGPSKEEGMRAAHDAAETLDELERALPELAAAGPGYQHVWRAWFDRAAQATQVALCLRESRVPQPLGDGRGPAASRAFAAAAERLARRHLRATQPILLELGTPASDIELAI